MRKRQPISDAAVRDLGSIPGVVSVGVGQHEGEQAIILGVRSEADMDAVDAEAPPTVEGLPVVIEVKGDPAPAAFAAEQSPGPLGTVEPGPRTVIVEERTKRFRPVPGGVSIGHVDVTAGTSSFVLTDGGSVSMLSNRHVMAPGGSSIGDYIIQPGSIDGGETPDDIAGELENYVPHNDGVLGDMAWMRPINPQTGPVEVTHHIEGLGPVEGEPYEPEVGDTLICSGVATGVTSGEVKEVNQYVNGYMAQIETEGMAKPGDSGSPVVYEDDQGRLRPAGMVWGVYQDDEGNIGDTIISPAWGIEEESNMKIVADGRDYPWDESPCDGVTCPPGESCVDGACVPDDTEPEPTGVELVVGNPTDENILYLVSVDGEITSTEGVDSDHVTDTNVNTTVPPGDADTIYYDGCVSEFSWTGPEPIADRDGEPISLADVVECPGETDPCDGVTCPSGESCVDGECVPDDPPDPNPCDFVSCPTGYECEDGDCVPTGPCVGVDCPEGEMCDDGDCVPEPAPCDGVSCPDGQVCVDGECVDERGGVDRRMAAAGLGALVLFFLARPDPDGESMSIGDLF